jgi:hypothetical protein
MKSEKYNGLWPLPGGVNGYSNTLINIIKEINNNNYTMNELVNWFKKEYKLSGVSTPKSMLDYMIRFGFFKKNNNKIELTEDSKKILETNDKSLIYYILYKKILGIDDIISWLIPSNGLETKEIHRKLIEKYNLNWNTEAQTFFRLNWLKSLDVIETKGRKYYLTQIGEKLAFNNKGVSPIPDKDTIIKVDTNITNLLKNKNENEIINNIKQSQNDTKNPEIFEKNITEAFDYLGFDSKHIGGSGEPDVILSALNGVKNYTVIIDCKTDKSSISDQRVDWPTLKDHQKKNNADYVAVVAPSFSGSRIENRAIEYNVLLLDTNIIFKLLELHNKYPFTLIDLKYIFEKKGLFKEQYIKDYEDILKSNINNLFLLKETLLSIEELPKRGEIPTINSVTAYLKYKKDFKCNENGTCLALGPFSGQGLSKGLR